MHRLIYRSRATGVIDKETFRNILYTSVELNRKYGVNGALIASRTHYLQFLEGEYEVVEKTYAKIQKDERHKDIQLITFAPVEQILFTGWRMRGFGLFGLNLELEKRLKEKYGVEEGTIRLPDEEAAALAIAMDVDMISISHQ